MSRSAIERRAFLKLSATTAVAAALAACGATPTATPPPPTATKPPAPTATAVPPAPTATKPPATAAPAAPAPTAAPPPPTAAPAAPAMNYKEAPALAELVKAGKLPPVAQRLPANPRVLKPIEQVGKYGGLWRRAYQGISDRWGPTKLLEDYMTQFDWNEGNIKIVPNLCEKWEQNATATEYTYYLRKGIRWSDGEEFNTDDIKFWYNDVLQNKDITPTIPSDLRNADGKVCAFSFPDKYTLKVGLHRFQAAAADQGLNQQLRRPGRPYLRLSRALHGEVPAQEHAAG